MDSFLSNESEEDEKIDGPRKPKVSNPDRKIYDIESRFYQALKEDISYLQKDTQKILVSLTGIEEGGIKRLPYNIFRSFEKTLKDFRKLKVKVIEENKKLALPFS